MTASHRPQGTTPDRFPRSVAQLLAAVALLLACVPAAADAAAGDRAARTQVERIAATAAAPHAAPTASASARRGCAPARGVLAKRKSIVRTRRRLLCLMNRVRARFGLPRLRANRCLSRVASRHSHDMVRRRYFAHVTPNGRDPGSRARASGYVPRSGRWIVGENIAWGVAGAARPAWVVRAWMHSPSHRHNILHRGFRDVGVGVARGAPYRGFGRWRLRATFTVEFGARSARTACGRAR